MTQESGSDRYASMQHKTSSERVACKVESALSDNVTAEVMSHLYGLNLLVQIPGLPHSRIGSCTAIWDPTQESSLRLVLHSASRLMRLHFFSALCWHVTSIGQPATDSPSKVTSHVLQAHSWPRFFWNPTYKFRLTLWLCSPLTCLVPC